MALLPAIFLFSTIVPLGLFVAYFGFRSNWYSSKIGRIILGLAASLLALLVIGLIGMTFDPAWLDAIRTVVYLAMHIGVWRFFITLRHVQRANSDGSLEPTDITKLWSAIARRKPKRPKRTD